MNQRINYIDLAKGICILLVILNHIEGPMCDKGFNNTLLSFRMPLFFFLSGLFFKSYSGLLNFSLRKINKLLVPFFFFLTITYLMFLSEWVISGHYNYISALPHEIITALMSEDVYLNIPLWFLFALFGTSVIFYLSLMISNKLTTNKKVQKVTMALLCLFIGVAGFELGIHRINLPLWIDTSMTSIPFYYTGYFLRQETDILAPNKLDKYIPALLVILGLLVYFQTHFIRMVRNEYQGNFISFYVCAISGTLFVILISKVIKKLPIISFIGRYSIIALGTHWIIIGILKKTLFFITNSWALSITTFILVILISIPVIKLLKKYFPKFVSQQDLIKVD